MRRVDRFTLRCSEEERRMMQALARGSRRTPSGVSRVVLHTSAVDAGAWFEWPETADRGVWADLERLQGIAPMTSATPLAALSQRLSPQHLRMLREESAIADEVILHRGYRTVADAALLRKLGFAPAQCRVPALLLPIWATDGGDDVAAAYMIRPDAPRCFDQTDKPRLRDGTYPQEVLKYEQQKGASLRLDCPPSCQPQLGDPAIPLYITEGIKKGDALASRGLCAVAMTGGVWGFRGKNAVGGLTALADWEAVALEGPRGARRLRFGRHAQARGAAGAEAHHRVPAEPRGPRERDLPAAPRGWPQARRG